MDTYFKNKRLAIAASIFCMALWGSAVPLIKTTFSLMHIASDDLGAKILIAGIRFFMAGMIALMYYYAGHRHKDMHVNVNWKYVAVLSVLQTSIHYLFYYLGLANTMGVKASVIQASNAFFVMVISAIVIRSDKITFRKMAALLVGMAGIVVVNLNQGSTAGFRWNGEGFILIATIFNASATVFIRRFGREQDSALTTGLQFIVGSTVLMVIGMIMVKEMPVFSPVTMLMLVYGAFVSATAFTLWSAVLKWQDSGEFGVYRLFIPIFGSVFSVIFLHETLTWNLIAGMVLVLLGTMILNKKNKV